MLTWLVAVATPGRNGPPPTTTDLGGGWRAALAHEPGDEVAYTTGDGRVAFRGWATGPHRHMGGCWCVEPGGLTAFSGWMWPQGWSPRQGTPWARQLAERYDSPPRGGIADCSGSFSVVRIDADGGGWIASDRLGTGLVYRRSTAGWVAFSNRADVVAGLAPRAAKDTAATAWLPFFGYWLDRSTSFAGVDVLPTGAVVRLDDPPEVDQPPSRWADGTGADVDDAIDRAGGALVDKLRRVAEVGEGRPVMRLSGGKDSRLVLAAMAHAGVLDAFRFRTTGRATDPDVAVAGRLAEELALDWDHRPSPQLSVGSATFDRRLRRHVFATSGMFGAWDLKSGFGQPDDLKLSGLFGEIARSHYGPDRELQTPREARSFFRESMSFDAARLLRPEHAAGCRERVADWIERRLDEGVAPADLPDAFYTEFRLRRWIGSAAGIEGRSPRAEPLQLPELLEAGIAVGHHGRRLDEVTFRLIRRLHEPLARLPLAGTGWQPGLLAEVAGGRDYAREPVTGSGSATSWQVTEWPRLRPVFVTHLLADDHPVHALIDPERTYEAINRLHHAGGHQAVGLWGALTAAVWVAHAETRRPVVAPDGDGSAAAGDWASPFEIRAATAEDLQRRYPPPTASGGAVRYDLDAVRRELHEALRTVEDQRATIARLRRQVDHLQDTPSADQLERELDRARRRLAGAREHYDRLASRRSVRAALWVARQVERLR